MIGRPQALPRAAEMQQPPPGYSGPESYGPPHGVQQQYHDYQHQHYYMQQGYYQPPPQQHMPHAPPPSYPAPQAPAPAPPPYQPPAPAYAAPPNAHWQQSAGGWQQQGAAQQPYTNNMTAQSGVYPVALPPMDPEQHTTIDKTAGYCARNGQAFENMIREREGANPKFSFLHLQGEGSAYFRWRVHCMAQGLGQEAMDAILQEAFPHPSAQEEQEFKSLLEGLTGSKDTIRSLRSWIMSHERSMDWICEVLRHRCVTHTEFTARLHTVYVINDVLHACLKRRDSGPDPAAPDPASAKLYLHVARILPMIFQQAGEGESQAKVTKVVGLWKDRRIFDAQQIENLQNSLMNPDPAPVPPATVDMSSLASYRHALAQLQPQPQPHPSAPAPGPPPAPAPHEQPPHPAPQDPSQPPPPYHPPAPPTQPMDYAMQPPPAYQPPIDPAPLPPAPYGHAPPVPVPPPAAGMPHPGGMPGLPPAGPGSKPLWSTPDEMPAGLVVYAANLMRMGGSPAYTPIPPHICPQSAPPAAASSQLQSSIDKFYGESLVDKLRRAQREKREHEEAEEAAKQRAVKEAAEAEAAAAAAAEEEAAKKAAQDGGGAAVPGAARSAVNWCTPRKIVPKVSNQIVGLSKAKAKKTEEEEDDDVADVFKV